MSKIILCKLSKKSNYKKIENVVENVVENVEENKTIVNSNSISEKKSYLQLFRKFLIL